MPSNFFIENNQIIGLWMLYAIVMLLVYCIIEILINSIVSKIKRTRRIKKRKIQEEKEFTRLVNKARVSSQIRAIMNVQL